MPSYYKRVVLHHRVIVNKTDGVAIEGVLWDETGPLLVLKGAVLHDRSNGEPVPLDGEVIVERASVNFVQVLP